MKRSSYPLQWPDRWPRTKPADRRRSNFGDRGQGQLSPYETAKELIHEFKLLGARDVVITTLLPTRHDGLPYSDGRSEDPGVAVWCRLGNQERVFPCDAWRTHGENMRAIAKSIEALRGLARWGMAGAVERATYGFAALPPGDGEPPAPTKPHWRDVFGVAGLALAPEDLLAVVKARHRKLIAEAHPDAGGDVDRAAELNVALDDATAELAK
jgi:hypothetical protein